VASELTVPVKASPVFELAKLPFVTVQSPLNAVLVARLREKLDAGEAEALALAVEVGPDAVLVDDGDARRIAAQMNLPVAGVLSVLAQAKRAGLVPAVGPLIDRLVLEISFRVSPQVRAIILADARESGGQLS